MAAIDWTDPCARAKALSDAYYALMAGQREQEITYQDGNSQRTVRFHSGALDLNRLKAEMVAAQEECETGVAAPRGRVAIQGGSLNRGYRGGDPFEV